MEWPVSLRSNCITQQTLLALLVPFNIACLQPFYRLRQKDRSDIFITELKNSSGEFYNETELHICRLNLYDNEFYKYKQRFLLLIVHCFRIAISIVFIIAMYFLNKNGGEGVVRAHRRILPITPLVK